MAFNLDKYNFITENSKDLDKKFIFYAEKNINRAKYIIELSTILIDIKKALALEKGIFEFSFIHTFMNNFQQKFVISVYLDKINEIINNIDDLIFIIRVLDFWQINDTPYEIYDYVFKNKVLIESNFDLIKSEFNEKNNIICEIDIIINNDGDDICDNAANTGSLNFVKYLFFVRLNLAYFAPFILIFYM